MTAFPSKPFKNGLGLTTIGAPDDMMDIFFSSTFLNIKSDHYQLNVLICFQ